MDGAAASHVACAISPLREGAIVELSVEPIAVARHVLLHSDIQVGLQQRDARDLVEGLADEAAHALVVACAVTLGSRLACGVDQRIHLLVLIAHGVEHGVLAVIAPEEEVLRVIQPAGEEVHYHRQLLLEELGPPVGPGDFIDRGLDSDLRKALLHKDADRLADDGKAEIERQRGFQSVREACFGQQRLGLGDVGGVAMRLRPDGARCRVRLGSEHRSEEHTSELQSHHDLVCRLLLEKKKKKKKKQKKKKKKKKNKTKKNTKKKK